MLKVLLEDLYEGPHILEQYNIGTYKTDALKKRRRVFWSVLQQHLALAASKLLLPVKFGNACIKL